MFVDHLQFACITGSQIGWKMEDKIIGFLKKKGCPCSAHQISKGVGEVTANDVIPTICLLEKQRRIQKTDEVSEGKEPVWYLVQGSSSHKFCT